MVACLLLVGVHSVPLQLDRGALHFAFGLEDMSIAQFFANVILDLNKVRCERGREGGWAARGEVGRGGVRSQTLVLR